MINADLLTEDGKWWNRWNGGRSHLFQAIAHGLYNNIMTPKLLSTKYIYIFNGQNPCASLKDYILYWILCFIVIVQTRKSFQGNNPQMELLSIKLYPQLLRASSILLFAIFLHRGKTFRALPCVSLFHELSYCRLMLGATLDSWTITNSIWGMCVWSWNWWGADYRSGGWEEPSYGWSRGERKRGDFEEKGRRMG